MSNNNGFDRKKKVITITAANYSKDIILLDIEIIISFRFNMSFSYSMQKSMIFPNYSI